MHSTSGSTSHHCNELGVIVSNARDERTLAWLRGQVDDEAIRLAVRSLAGQRRPFLTNVARALNIELPHRILEVTPRDVALGHLAQLRKRLAAR